MKACHLLIKVPFLATVVGDFLRKENISFCGIASPLWLFMAYITGFNAVHMACTCLLVQRFLGAVLGRALTLLIHVLDVLHTFLVSAASIPKIQTQTTHAWNKQRLSRTEIIIELWAYKHSTSALLWWLPWKPGSCQHILIINTHHKNISNVSEPYASRLACQRKKKKFTFFYFLFEARHWSGLFF